MCISGSVGYGGTNSPDDVKTVQLLLSLSLPRVDTLPPPAVSGILDAGTQEAIRAFQARVVGMASPDGRVDPGGATLRALGSGLPPGFSADKLQGIMISARAWRVRTFADLLAEKMADRGIDTLLRQSHFLAQVGHESGELNYTEEIASGNAYEGRTDLGNTEPGDGQKFKGRGLIQLTGRANYAAYGSAIGVNLIDGDDSRRIATDPELAVDVACWFWASRQLNQFADRDDIEEITRRINGGLNGLADRERQLGRAKFFLQA